MRVQMSLRGAQGGVGEVDLGGPGVVSDRGSEVSLWLLPHLCLKRQRYTALIPAGTILALNIYKASADLKNIPSRPDSSCTNIQHLEPVGYQELPRLSFFCS